MSYQAKGVAQLNQQLKIQELVVRAADTHLHVVNGGDVCVTIGEALDSVVSCQFHDNSAPSLTSVVAADLIVSDSSDYSAGGDRKAIRVNGVAALDANDHLIIKYIVTE